MRCLVATLAALGLVTSSAATTHARPNCPEVPLAGDPSDPDPDPDPEPPPPPPPYVSTPDAVFQIGSCLPGAFEGDVRSAVQGMVPGNGRDR